MRKLVLAGWLMATTALSVGGATTQAGAQGQNTLVIQGGTLVDGNGGAPLANAVIVIQGNRIAAVGAAGAVQVPPARKSSMRPANGSRPASSTPRPTGTGCMARPSCIGASPPRW